MPCPRLSCIEPPIVDCDPKFQMVLVTGINEKTGCSTCPKNVCKPKPEDRGVTKCPSLSCSYPDVCKEGLAPVFLLFCVDAETGCPKECSSHVRECATPDSNAANEIALVVQAMESGNPDFAYESILLAGDASPLVSASEGLNAGLSVHAVARCLVVAGPILAAALI